MTHAPRQSDSGMKPFLLGLADHVHAAISARSGMLKNRSIQGYSPGGDAQFHIDRIAEQAVAEYLQACGRAVALFTEDGPLTVFGADPEYLLIVDPIDGTRPAAAGLEMATIAIAVARFRNDARIGDVLYALVKEVKSGACLYADRHADGIDAIGYPYPVPRLNPNTSLDNLFWSFEFNGHPADLMVGAYGHVIDRSANNGAVFIFNSVTFSISRIITGQLDAYVDIGNRLLKDQPALLSRFQQVGNGKVLHLFPYDIAAITLIAEKAGVVITDAYGRSLDDTGLLDNAYVNQQSCIAAANAGLHRQLLDTIRWP